MRFWYNHVTGVSQWEVPDGIDESRVEEQPMWQEGEHQESYEAQEVHDLDDLGI